MTLRVSATYKQDQTQYTSHIASTVQDDGRVYGSTARVHGTKYSDRKSEDSCLLASGFTQSSLNRQTGERMLDLAFSEARDAAHDVGSGAGTMAAAIRTRDGISVKSAGDTVVTVVGDNGIYQLTLDQVRLSKRGLDDPINGIGYDVKSQGNDYHYFISYEEIRSRVGDNAQVVIGSDGLYDTIPDDYLQSYKSGLQTGQNMPEISEMKWQTQTRYMQTAVRELGQRGLSQTSPDFASALASYARSVGGRDDIGVVCFPATPPQRAEDYTLGVVCDGAGGHGAGDLVSQAATKAIEQFVKGVCRQNGVEDAMRTYPHEFNPENIPNRRQSRNKQREHQAPQPQGQTFDLTIKLRNGSVCIEADLSQLTNQQSQMVQQGIRDFAAKHNLGRYADSNDASQRSHYGCEISLQDVNQMFSKGWFGAQNPKVVNELRGSVGNIEGIDPVLRVDSSMQALMQSSGLKAQVVDFLQEIENGRML